LTPAEEAALIDEAWAARERAYAPYSGFAVGAALLCDDGQVVVGCNVECAAYSGTICAERTAIVSAVARGLRNFRAIAVVTEAEHLTTPCGACRQLMAELAPHLQVIYANRSAVGRRTVGELLPEMFTGAVLTPRKA
jgi:cytidine deaminase